MSVLRRPLRAFVLFFLVLTSVLAHAADPTVPSEDDRRRQAAAERGNWLANCGTLLGTSLLLNPWWGWRVNARRNAAGAEALADLETRAKVAADQVDALLGEAPPGLPTISASLGIERFFQAMYPSAYGDGQRHWDEEQGRDPKWLALARDESSREWTRGFVSAVDAAAALADEPWFAYLPEMSKARLTFARRLKQAMPPEGWVEQAIADPTLGYRFDIPN